MGISNEIEFRVFSKEFINDPYKTFEAIQKETSAFHVAGLLGREWVVTRHDDVVKCLRDKVILKLDVNKDIAGRGKYAMEVNGLKCLARVIDNWMFFKEGEKHIAFKRLLGPEFATGKINQMRTPFRKIIQRHIDKFKNGQPFDVLDCVVSASFDCMIELLGCPYLQNEDTIKHAIELFHITCPPVPMKQYKVMEHAAQYFEQNIDLSPNAHLIKGSLHARVNELYSQGELSQEECFGIISMLLSIGLDTTKHFVGNVLHSMNKNGLLSKVANLDDKDLDVLIMENARVNAPVAILPRMATADCTVGDVEIKAGERVFLMLGASCRDERIFECAAKVAPERSKKTKLMFGYGLHFCLGTYMAQTIAREFIRHLANNSFECNEQSFTWMNYPGMRGLESLEGTIK